MELLSDTLPVVGPDLQPRPDVPPWTRVQPEDQKHLKERDWDDLLLLHAQTVESALRNADILRVGCKLKVLDKQVSRVDVLMAEVHRDTDVPRRLVLFEDKLISNPQAKREALAQILEYAAKVPKWTLADLQVWLPQHGNWIRDNAAQIREILRHGELLLVIVGNKIHPDLESTARALVTQQSPLLHQEICLLALSTFQRKDEILLAPHVVSAFTKAERELSIRVVVETEYGKVLPAHVEDASSPRRSRPDQATESDQDAPSTAVPEVPRFLRLVGEQMNGTLAPGWTGTTKPRKRLDWYISPDAKGRSAARLVVHFGGWTKGWRPLFVGFDGVTDVAGLRERWKERFEGALREERLPPSTEIKMSGEQSLSALVAFPWEDPLELDGLLANKVCAHLEAFRDVVEPMMGLSENPGIMSFVAKAASVLDPEMEERGWEKDHVPTKSVQYYASSKDGLADVYGLVSFGSEDPGDCSRIRVGVQVSTASTQLRDKYLAALQSLAGEGGLPSPVELEPQGSKNFSALVEYAWQDATELNDDLHERVNATFRQIRDALVRATGFP